MQTYSALKHTIDSSGLNENEKKNMLGLLGHRVGGQNDERYDDAYMHCLLRPEDANSTRIPSEYGRHSSVLKQHSSFTFNTGAIGEGLFGFLPQDFAFSQGFFLTDTANASENAPGLSTVSGSTDNYKRMHAMTALQNGDIQENFQSARVVGCSMNVSWIGDDDDETGILVASHLYDYNIGIIDTDKIDNGHHQVQHRPSKGLRMIYLPRSQQDFEFCSLDSRLQCTKAQSLMYKQNTFLLNPADYVKGGDATSDTYSEKALYLEQRGVTQFDTTLARAGGITWAAKQSGDQRSPQDYMGTGPRSAYMNCPLPQVLAFYWKGMPVNKDWLRVDIVRHLELTPRPFLREMVSVQRPIHCAESQKTALKLASKDSRHVVSSIEQAEAHKPLVTAGIASAHSNSSLLDMINHALWPPSWSGPIGDAARFVNAPQKALIKGLTGYTDQQLWQQMIPAGMGMAAAALTGGESALVPYAIGQLENTIGKQMTDYVMNESGIDTSYRQPRVTQQRRLI